MKITWLGHSGFRIAIEQAVLLVDPWLTGNPLFPADRREGERWRAPPISSSPTGMATIPATLWPSRRSGAFRWSASTIS